MPEIKLKNCPFCGSAKLKIDRKSKFVHYKNVYYVTVSVRCNCCHGRGGTVSGEIRGGLADAPKSDNLTTYDNLRIKAAEAWNRRTEKESPLPVEYEADGYDDNGNLAYDTAYCPNCRNEYEVDYDYHDNYCRKCGQKLDWRTKNETN